jgi:hypothetical protein
MSGAAPPSLVQTKRCLKAKRARRLTILYVYSMLVTNLRTPTGGANRLGKKERKGANE